MECSVVGIKVFPLLDIEVFELLEAVHVVTNLVCIQVVIAIYIVEWDGEEEDAVEDAKLSSTIGGILG